MTKITEKLVERLIELEASINYDTPPSKGERSFIVEDRSSSVLISAPHGARTFRNNRHEIWHEEDEYTAGMARLLGEICKVPIIAMIARSDSSDPNYHNENDSKYKQKLRKLIETDKIKYVIDLHGAAKKSGNLAESQLVDLGLGDNDEYLPRADREKLIELIESQLGRGVSDRQGKIGFPAANKRRIANFCHKIGAHAVQIEMKPQIRVVHRYPTASLYKSCGEFAADPNDVIHMLQALVDFIEYLKEQTE